jgi:DNA-binding XRE family transcriptional regulator
VGLEVKITNNIDMIMRQYQDRTGVTRKEIASQLNISTSRLYAIMNSDNLMLNVACQLALLFNCSLEDLFKYEKI